jgi:hypothetical protein
MVKADSTSTITLILTAPLTGNLGQVHHDLEGIRLTQAYLTVSGHMTSEFTEGKGDQLVRGFICPVPTKDILRILRNIKATGYSAGRDHYQIFCWRTPDAVLNARIEKLGFPLMDKPNKI